ncbi:GM14780 [Drosophila sechellia]|uniref:GM14780 n=1 Tax=Drosophila sechellia TaxID=7238 RepID=B4HUU3_DROSE|nr:GM14780 [Drosophila sechellia]
MNMRQERQTRTLSSSSTPSPSASPKDPPAVSKLGLKTMMATKTLASLGRRLTSEQRQLMKMRDASCTSSSSRVVQLGIEDVWCAVVWCPVKAQKQFS